MCCWNSPWIGQQSGCVPLDILIVTDIFEATLNCCYNIYNISNLTLTDFLTHAMDKFIHAKTNIMQNILLWQVFYLKNYNRSFFYGNYLLYFNTNMLLYKDKVTYDLCYNYDRINSNRLHSLFIIYINIQNQLFEL